MSSSLIFGLLIGLAVGGPLYYAYLTFTKKRKHAVRSRLMETMREEQAAKEEQEVKKVPEEHNTLEGREE